jgi:hypothetical protein
MRKDQRLCGDEKRSKRRGGRGGSCIFLRLGGPDRPVLLINITRDSAGRLHRTIPNDVPSALDQCPVSENCTSRCGERLT